MDRNKELKVHRLRLPGRSLCSIRSNRKWCKRRGSSLQCQNCFFVYPIIDCNLKNLPICTQRFLRRVSSVFCPELRRQSQPQQFLSTSLSFSFDLIWLIFSYTSSILNFSYHRFLSSLETCPQGSFSPMISNLSFPT